MVNGTTGFGKSNVMRMALSTIVAKHSPAEIQFVILDMKNNGDFRQFEDVPHCIQSVFNVQGAFPLMLSLFHEMQRRQELIRRISNDIDKFNRVVSAGDRIPHILVVFDEYPAIHVEKTIAKEIDKYTSQIAIQGRAAGMHLFLSGQQAYSSYVPSLVTANITSRFTAKQSSVGASMSTVGDRSALRMKNLPGRFLCTSEGDRNFQVQMPFIEDNEIDMCVNEAHQWDKIPKVTLPDVQTHQLDDTQPITPIKDVETPEQMIIRCAIEELDGVLKGIEIWELLDRKIGRNRVWQLINKIVTEPVFYDGMRYIAVKSFGNFYTLKPEIEPVSA
jgi:DNA segregation ATPase FtsK/SpoIIIE-like protein